MEFPNVKAVAINGIPPAIEAVRTGQYKYFFEVGFVTKGQPTGTAKKFIEFVASADGEKILGKYGMAVAK